MITENLETTGEWALLTVTSLKKQLIELDSKARTNEGISAEVKTLNVKLDNLISEFDLNDVPICELFNLVEAVSRLKNI